MATIQTAIQLQDNFTEVFYRVIEAVNLGFVAMEELQQSISSPVDMTSMEVARNSIHRAAAAVQELNESLQHTNQLEVSSPVISSVSEKSYGGEERFTNTGVEQFQQELTSVHTILHQISMQQDQITRRANEMELLSPQASYEIQSVENQVHQLRSQIEQVEANSLTIGTEESNQALERLQLQMNRIHEEQKQLQLTMQGTDVSAINQAYLQLSQTLDEVERSVQESFSQPVDLPISPVEVPITWKTENLEVFTGTGVERFQQEANHAKVIMEQLYSTQTAIARQAGNMTLLPVQAQQDFSQMAVRIEDLQNKVQAMTNNSLNFGTDAANAGLEHTRGLLIQIEVEQQNLSHAMEIGNVSAINAAYLQLSQTIGSTERYIRDNVNAEGQFQSAIRETGQLAQRTSGEFHGWQKAIILANQALNLIKNTLGQIGLFNLSGAFERLDTMNRFQKTVTIMTGDANMASAALERLKDITKGTAYGLDVAAKSTQNFLTRGMSLGAATDQVRVWADAVSFYGNGTNEQLENVIDAIGKIYSKGTVEQTQLDRLFDAGIGAAELYAEAVGRSVSEVKDDLTNRRIGAADFIQTVTEVLDAGVSAGAAKDAGNTWSATFANVSAAINRGWVDILTNLDAALASRGLPSAMQMISTFGQRVEDVLQTIGGAMGTVVDIVVNIYEILSEVGGFFIENWSIIAPIILAVAAAIGVYNGAMTIATAIVKAKTLIDNIHNAALAMQGGATFMATVRQKGLNAALLACPITKIVVGIIALIAVIFIVCNAIAKMTGIANSGFSVITGGINVVIQFFWNLFLTVLNIVLGIINAIGALADNMMTAFFNAICSVQSWFYDLLSTVLTVVGKICEALNRLPFVEFDYSGVTSAAEKYAAKAAEALEKKKEYENVWDAFQEGFHTFDTFQDGWITDAFQKGADWGDKIVEKISGFDLFSTEDFLNPDDYTNLLNDTNSLLSEIGDTTKGISDSLDITEEDLKYMRDLAERETINRVTMTDIKIDMGGVTNHVNSEIDLDGMINHLTEALETQIAISAEGIH